MIVAAALVNDAPKVKLYNYINSGCIDDYIHLHVATYVSVTYEVASNCDNLLTPFVILSPL